jgi:hypothetical protein
MFKVPNPPNTPEIRYGSDGKYSLNGGINLWRQETSMSMNQASNILNLNADDRGTLSKRKGQVILNEIYPSDDLFPSDSLYPSQGLGSGGCVAIVYKGKIIVQWSTFLYSFNLDGSNPTEIYSGLTNAKAFFVIFQGILYMLNGNEYIQYDGSTVQPVQPYIPVVTQGRKNDGSVSTLFEPLNLLTGGFTDMFSPLGTETVFKLSFDGLDLTTVTANNGTTEGAGFTVNRTTGEVTFSVAPAAGTNTLKITAYKTNPNDALQIKNCTTAIEFSSRLFITGNPNYPNRLWKTGLTSEQLTIEANYFPASGLSSFDSVTSSDEPMTAFVKKYDKLIYLKTKSTHITYNQTQSDGTSGFPITPINETIGCDMPGSIQLVDNMPVFFNSQNGGYAIVSTTVLGENELKDLSLLINGGIRQGLLQESDVDLRSCSSFDDGEKYYLCMPNSGRVYVWDYSLGYNLNNPETLHWFIYDNIYANNFFIVNNELHYASSKFGVLVKFTDVANDFGRPINSLWKTKLMDFGIAEYYKNIVDIWLTTRANSSSSIYINYYDDNGDTTAVTTIPSSNMKTFKWSTWNWANFTWKSQKFPPTLRFKPGIKNVRYFQIEISNNNVDENLSIIALVIKWISTRKVR